MERESTSSTSYGKFIRELRETNNIPLRGLAETLQISPAYMSEIERGTRCAPAIATDIPRRLMEALGVAENAGDPQYHHYCDLAGESRGFSYEEINRYLAKQPVLRQIIRLADKRGLDDAFWREVLRFIG